MGEIMVVIEHRQGKVRDISLEILSKADALYGYRTDAGAPMNTSFMREGEKDVYIVSGALFDSGEDFTVDLSWEKGYVSQAAFWHDWLTYNYGFVFGGIIVLLSILYWIIYYIRTEVLPKGRGTIIPQYDPPRGLRPATAELLVRERVSRRAWPATIVDLAVRGYVEITEEGKRLQIKSIAYLIMGIFPLAFLVVLILDKEILSSSLFFIVFLFFTVYLFRVSGSKYGIHYEIKSKKPYEFDTELESYEQFFLKTLFSLNDENVFRTKDLTGMHFFDSKKREMFAQAMHILPQLLQTRVDQESWYEVKFKKERWAQTTGWTIIFAAVALSFSLAKVREVVTALVPAEAFAAAGKGMKSLSSGFRRVLTGEGERLIYKMGMVAALVFAAQMFNFPISNGTSGHLIGGVFAAVVLGPFAGTIVIAAVLIVQSLFFGDGGLLALGANVVNMAVFASFGCYYIYSWLKRYVLEWLAISLAAWISVVLASFVCALALRISGTIPFAVVIPAMVKVHMIIGIAEALITVVLVNIFRTMLKGEE